MFVHILLISIIGLFSVPKTDSHQNFSLSEINFNSNDSSVTNNVTYYSYHIHVYFSAKSIKQRREATVLRNRFLTEFNVSHCFDACDTWCPRICHWDLNYWPVGPHPTGSWGIYLPLEQFTQALSFISMYHGNLSVLIHPNSGRQKIDHLVNGLWIKSILPLNGTQLYDFVEIPANGRLDPSL